MSKDEAIQALQEGKRLAHRTFLRGEYVEQKDGVYVDERGHHLNIALFWRWRKGVWWDCDWYEYESYKTNA